jgi:DNA-binding phage protein
VPVGTPAKLKAARALRDSGELTMSEIAEQVGVSRNTLYRNLREAP